MKGIVIFSILSGVLFLLLLVLFGIRTVRLRRRRLRRRRQLASRQRMEQQHAAREQLNLEFQQRREQQHAEEEFQQLEFMQRSGAVSADSKAQEMRIPNAAELVKLYDCYIPNTAKQYSAPQVRAISLTGQEAAAQGFSFRKKSKTVRISNYHGDAAQLVIPSAIDGMPVNEIVGRAFAENRTLRRVEIPASVRRIGAGAFCASMLEHCVIAAQVQELPEAMFEKCRQLAAVQLPETLVRIGVNAFSECRSLHNIAFPARLRHIGDHAFRGSGLSGFTVMPRTQLTNGAAFCHTPLHNNYQFVLSRVEHTRAHLLLGGSRISGMLAFPAGMMLLVMRGALEFCSAREFDFSKCKRVYISHEAFLPHVVQDGLTTMEKHARLILPQQTDPTWFPPYIRAEYADGTPFVQCAVPADSVRTNEDHVKLTTPAYVLASYSIRGSMSGMTLVQEEGKQMTSDHHAFVTPELVSLKAPLSGECRELFSVRCRRVQRVQFPENGENITKYIPDRALIGTLHEELLGAFKGDGTHFFDRSVYDTVFIRGTYHWTDGSIRPLSQKQRLMMCFDVLRSTQREHEERPLLYIAYLVGHLRYARRLCKKIEPTHPEYLRWLAAQDPTEWFSVYPEAKQYFEEKTSSKN